MGYLLLVPAAILLLAFAYWPLVRTLWLGILPASGTSLPFSNFWYLLHDDYFWRSLLNTLIFTGISLTLEFLLGLVFALLMNLSFRGRGILRASILIPWALPPAVMAMGWRWIFNDTYGILNHLLLRLNLLESPIAWLGDPFWAMFAAIVADIWKTTPFIAIIILAGLQSIPDELYEAASIDGASYRQSFFLITLPLLRPYLGLALLFRFIQAYGVFDLIWVLTGGGPAGATQTIALYIYDNVFRYLRLDYGSALTIMGFLISALLALPFIWLSRPRHDD